LFLGVPSILGVWYFGWGLQDATSGQRYLGTGTCSAFFFLAVYLLLTTIRSKIVLYADRIEMHELTATHTMRRDEIAGWRLGGDKSQGALVLHGKPPTSKIVSTAWTYSADAALDQWFDGLANLDEKELEEAIDEIADDYTLGIDEQERFERLARAQRTAQVLNLAGGALCAWGVFYPRPYDVVIFMLLAAPWIAAAAGWRFDGLIRLDGRASDLKPNLAVLFLLPMAALTLRAVFDYETVGWKSQTTAAFVIAAMLFAAQWVAYEDVRTSRTGLLIFLFNFLAYGYGAALHINALAETADMEQTRYHLREKYVSNGRHEVKLAKAHANAPDVSSAQVTRYFYNMLKPGDSVCLAMRPGALGIKWFMAGPCPPGTP